MAITWVGTSATLAEGTTTCTPTWPTGYTPTAGDLAVMVVTSGHPTAATVPATPAGWVAPTGNTLSGGGGTYGADVGPRRVTIFTRVLTGGDTLTAVTQAAGTQATIGATVTVFTNATDSWEVAVTTGQDTTAGTGFAAVGAANPGLVTGDAVLVGYAIRSDTPTMSAQAVTATGATFATATERRSTGTTQGNDHRHVVVTTAVTAGTASAAPSTTATLSASHTGVAAIARLRELAAAVTGQASVAGVGSGSASGLIERETGSAVTVTGARTAVAALVVSRTASVAVSASRTATAAGTRPSGASRAATAAITAAGEILPGGAVQDGQAALTGIASTAAAARSVSPWSGVVSATTFVEATEGQAARPVTATIVATAAVVRSSAAALTGAASISGTPLFVRAAAVSLTGVGTITATVAVTRTGQATLTVTSTRTAFGRHITMGQATLVVTASRVADAELGTIPILGQAALTVHAGIAASAYTFVTRPNNGRTIRPDIGETGRPNGRTIRPNVGETARPLAGTTIRP